MWDIKELIKQKDLPSKWLIHRVATYLKAN